MRVCFVSQVNVYCEPFCIEQGYQFEIHKVQYKADDPYSCFMHFHEVHEFIIFEQIDGLYFYNKGESTLKDNDIVFTPALETHDFRLSDKPKSWYIIQFLPELFNADELQKISNLFTHGKHLRLDQKNINIVQQQVNWLHQSYNENPLSDKSITLLKLLILWIGENSTSVKGDNSVPITSSSTYEKLSPAINLFKGNEFVEITQIQAAELCHVSPSHFSRLFKHVFRCSFSQYCLRHKLYCAARLLSQSEKSITEISYELNFSSPSHFIAQFRRQFSYTPRQYRIKVNNN